jgi:hypothetical protein
LAPGQIGRVLMRILHVVTNYHAPLLCLLREELSAQSAGVLALLNYPGMREKLLEGRRWCRATFWLDTVFSEFHWALVAGESESLVYLPSPGKLGGALVSSSPTGTPGYCRKVVCSVPLCILAGYTAAAGYQFEVATTRASRETAASNAA